MLSTSTYRGLCPFLYPPSARQQALHAHTCLRARGVRAIATSRRCLKEAPPASTFRPASPPSSSVPPSAGTAPAGSNVFSFTPNPLPSSSSPPAPVPQDPNAPPDPDAPAQESPQQLSNRLAQLPLRFLDRPLGLTTPPTTAKKGWKDVRDEMLDREKRLKERGHLVQQIMTGYYNDVHQLRWHGGKRWTAPEVLVKADKALYFPDIVGTPLSENKRVHTTDLCKGKISIVALIGSQMAETHVKSFTTLALESFGKDPLLRFVQINLQENPLKAFLVSLFTSRIRSQLPASLHPYYLLSSQNMEYYREPLACTNKMLGYVYLLDEDLKVRWAGGGHPNPEEQVSLGRCTGVLLKRLREKRSGKTATLK